MLLVQNFDDVDTDDVDTDDVGTKEQEVGINAVADTRHIAIHGGIPTLICGPQGSNTCEANEYVQISSLLPTARAYVQSVLALLGKA